jgi:cell division septum initiation protein DivIVA
VHTTSSWLLDPSSPDDVARANFALVRRGFDPVEVQGFARAVSGELIRMQAQIDDLTNALRAAETKASERVTEAMAAGYLGEETSRMLQTARETADSLERQARERAENLRHDTEDEAHRVAAESKGAAERTRHEAEQYSKSRRVEADQYALATRRQADEYAAQRDEASKAEADSCRRQATMEAERLVREAMDHRANLLKELARRRDLACAQVRSVLEGRDLVVQALDQVRIAASEIIGDIDELTASPADFVSLDPAIEGPGLGVDRAASLAVRRARQTQAATVAEPIALELPATTATPATSSSAAPAVKAVTATTSKAGSKRPVFDQMAEA